MGRDIEALESTTFGGKRFTRKQLAHIQETVGTFPALSRRELGHTICENLRWATPKGVHRIQACLGALAEMEEIGILTLPAKKKQKKATQKPIPWTDGTREQPRIAALLAHLAPIGVQPVTEQYPRHGAARRGSSASARLVSLAPWYRRTIARWHMLVFCRNRHPHHQS